MELKSRLDELIENKGYKKKYVAKQIGVSQVVLSRWVNNASVPSVVNCFKLADLLECTVDDLFEHKKQAP